MPLNPAYAGQLSDTGKTVFATSCVSSHGANGQGTTATAIIGPNTRLYKYSTAQGLFAYIKTFMPLNNPGSLSPAQYFQVLGYLLLQNNEVTQNTLIDPTQLTSIVLK